MNPLKPQATLHADDFTRNDVEAFHRLMTELVDQCRAVGERHPAGWQPESPDLLHQFGESMVIIADLSRTLNHSRQEIRRILDRARYRL
ncbi:hypothetical protein SHKM778_29070 [Streptomyces sp. KM77-8]|uniref:Uncharacterized protein n=1 Tax=Streptomyces haneummycinicus TaxID=3074435 RepID=A0AAT9HGB1_9ACTN